jgi:hypothetical protein
MPSQRNMPAGEAATAEAGHPAIETATTVVADDPCDGYVTTVRAASHRTIGSAASAPALCPGARWDPRVRQLVRDFAEQRGRSRVTACRLIRAVAPRPLSRRRL